MNKKQLFATKRKAALTILNTGIFLLGAAIVSHTYTYPRRMEEGSRAEDDGANEDIVHTGDVDFRL
jgi:hypothetical protein